MTPEDSNLLEQYHNAPNAQTATPPTILAMGVGGGGCNAVAYMHSQGVKGVDFVALNTDAQALNPIPVASKVLLGPEYCGGLGAGGKPEVGEAAATESIPEIEKLLTPNVKMVFVTAGMGGGTGTGGAPVVAKVAKDKGILTVGIVTIPFFFEGMNKIDSALRGAARLQQNVDALLMINNDRLGTIYPTMPWDQAFSKADEILTTSARTISDMVTTLGIVNIDMRDIDTCLRNGRTALISVGYGEGPGRMAQAIKEALYSPLLCDTDIMTAKELVFAFYYSHAIEPAFNVSEMAEANRLVAEIRQNVHIKFGWGYDDSLGNKIKFTMLASGFDVSVEIAGKLEDIIEGKADEESAAETVIDDRIAAAYGRDKVEDLQRQQERQNYFILTADQLDDDAAIEQLESSPAYKRDKRKAAIAALRQSKKDSADSDAAPAAPKATDNRIFFDPNDR